MWGKCGGCVNTKKLTTGLVRIEKSWWQCGRGDENEVWWSLASHAPGVLWTVWGNLSHWIKAGILWLRDTCGQCRMCQECTCTNLCSNSTPNIFYIFVFCVMTCRNSSWWVGVELGTCSVFVLKMEWIIEYAQLEETHKDHAVQLLSPGHPQESHHVPRSIVQSLLELCRAWCCDHFPAASVPVLSHPLGEKLLPGIQHKCLLTHL